MFIAINLIKENDISINKFPIIFENINDESSGIDQIKDNEVFVKYIHKNVHFSDFNDLSIYICYIIDQNSDYYYENEYKVKDILNFDDIYSWEDFIKYELSILCQKSLKKDFKESSILEMYSALLNRFPNKINKYVVINYLLSQLKEKNNDLFDTDKLNDIRKNFLNYIKDE